MSEAPAFTLFGLPHLLTLAALLALAVLVAVAAPQDRQHRLALPLAALLVAHEIFKLSLFIGVDGEPWAASLPLDLCRLNALLCAYLLVRRSYAVFQVSYFWALGGSLTALLSPDLRAGFPDVRFFSFFAGHASGIIAVLYAMGAFGFRPRLRSLGLALLVTGVYALLVAALNPLLDSNYLFLREKPQAASILDYFGPWPWYLPALVLLAVAACVLCYLPFARPWRLRPRNRPQSLCVALLITGPMPAADPLFESNQALAVRITAPLRALARERADEPAYRAATLGFADADGTARQIQVKLRPRGKSRRQRDVCTFPPLRLNLPRSKLAGTLFEGQDKLKLVTHCRRSPRHDRFVHREFLAYRILNEITRTSFRVRALDIEWVDTGRDQRSERRFGFLIEHEDRVAERLGLQAVDTRRVDRRRLAAEHTTLVELFQFLIGNTDFSFVAGPEGDGCCHNAKPLLARDGAFHPIPYDFDISGFVDPPYAVVDHQLPIRDVRQRLYRGFCRDAGVHARALARFRERRSAIVEVLRRESPLDRRSREAALAYVDEFYALLDDPRRLRREVLDACRG